MAVGGVGNIGQQSGIGAAGQTSASEGNATGNSGLGSVGSLGGNSQMLSSYADSVMVESAGASEDAATSANDAIGEASTTQQAPQQRNTVAKQQRSEQPATNSQQPRRSSLESSVSRQQPQQGGPGQQYDNDAVNVASGTNQMSQVAPVSSAPSGTTQRSGEAEREMQASEAKEAAAQAGVIKPIREYKPESQDQPSERKDWRAKARDYKPDPRSFGNKRGRSFAKDVKKRIKNALSGKTTVASGGNLNSKAVSDPSLDLSIQDVSVGTEAILELIRNDSYLLDRVNKASMEKWGNDQATAQNNIYDFKPEDFVDERTSAYTMDSFTRQVNALDIPVVVSKSPISEKSSTQVRRLRVHYGQGIAIHPVAAKGFTADFDGDGITVHFGNSFWGGAENCMAYLTGIDGKTLIDKDFFPMPIVRDADMFAEAQLPFLDKRTAINLIKACNKKDTQEIADIINNAYPVFEGMSNRDMNYAYKQRADLFDALYRSMYQVHVQGIMDISVESTFVKPEYIEVMDLSEEDMFLMNLVSEAVKGNMPPNYHDFINDLARFNGDIKGKNPQFRIGADLGKLMKFDMNVFSGEEDMRKLWVMSCRAINAKIMANKVFKGDEYVSASEWKKLYVARTAGMPTSKDGSPANFDEWLVKFVKAYNIATNIQETSRLQFRTDMSLVEESASKHSKYLPDPKDITGKTLAKAFVEIYGECNIERIFGHLCSIENSKGASDTLNSQLKALKNTIIANSHMSLSRFAMKTGNVIDSKAHEKKFSDQKDEYGDKWRVLFNAIADRANDKASDYNASLVGKDTEDKKTGKKKHVKGNLEAQLDHIASAASDIERMLKNADVDYDAREDLRWRTELLQSCGPDMYAYFNMDSVDGFWNSEPGRLMLNAKSVDELGGIRYSMTFEMRTDRIARLMERLNDPSESTYEIESQIRAEIAVLGSSSDVWGMITSELTSGNRIWNAFVRGDSFSKFVGKNAKSTAAEKTNFFEIKGRWNDVYSFIADPSVGKDMKDAVLSDLTRMHMGYMYSPGFAVAYQLESMPASAYAGSNTQGFSERSDDVLRDSLDQMTRRIDDSYISEGLALKDEHELMSVINHLAKPWNRYLIADELYADAITASMEKAYADTEKSQQQPAVNALYAALSNQRSGGLFSDVYRGDNRALGKIGYDQLSFNDVLELLADPQKSVELYDENGDTVVLSRETICGGVTEKDVFNFFRKNPRLYGHLRVMQASVSGNSDGTVRTVASNGITDTLQRSMKQNTKSEKTRQMLYELRDKPAWGAMVALFSPARGKNAMAHRVTVMQTEKDLLNLLAYIKATGNTPDLSGLKKIERDCPEIVRGKLEEYADLVFKDRSEAEAYGTSYKKLEFDDSSVSMFYDVRQVLSGAKTSVSTGVEGAETDRFAPMFPYLAQCENIYSMDGRDVVISDQQNAKSSGALRRLFSSAHAKFLAIKRSKGGEEFNLKAKKSGDDGLDSITKASKFLSGAGSWEQAKVLVEKAYREPSNGMSPRMAADIELARHLMERNEEMGYEGMDLSDYANMAHTMISETEDGIYVRSLEQMCTAVRTKLPRILDLDTNDIRDTPIEDIIGATSAIVDGIGEGGADILGVLYQIKIPSRGLFKPALRPRSSSFERNFEALTEMVKDIESHPEVSFISKRRMDYEQKELVRREHISKEDAEFLDWAFKSDVYSVVGCIGNDGMVKGQMMPGYRSIFWLSDEAAENPKNVQLAVDTCKKYGMTLACRDLSKIDKKITDAYAVIPSPSSGFSCPMIPFFDQLINGSGETKSGKWFFDESNVVVSVEDSLNEHGLGDASCLITQDMFDRINVKKRGTWKDSVNDMFYDSIDYWERETNGICKFKFSVASKADIEALFDGSVDPIDKMDLRIFEANKDYDDIADKTRTRLSEFISGWSGSEFERSGSPDRIVAFAKMTVIDPVTGSEIQTVLSPITPFTNYAGNSKSVPQSFDIANISYNESTGEFQMPWTAKRKLDGQFLKMFEGLAAGNKMMAYTGNVLESRSLTSGLPVDVMYAANTTSSRRLGWNARLQTMYSMMLQARMKPYGYNFADAPGAFPDAATVNVKGQNVDLVNAVRTGEVPMSEWMRLIDSKIRWHSDTKINAFLNDQIPRCIERGINPSDLLCTRYKTQQGWVNTRTAFEFDMLFKPGYQYQDGLMRFMNNMMSTLCPPGLRAAASEGTDYLFKPCRDKGFSFGALQQQVPRKGSDGVTRYTWENVYTSFGFFSDDYSAFHSPGIDGADIMMQELAAAIQSGSLGDDARLMGMFMDWAFADAGKANKPTQWEAADFEVVNELSDVDWDRSEAVCFTGHRPKDLYGKDNYVEWDKLKVKLIKAIEEQYANGKRVFIHGGAQGVDMIAAEAVQEFARTHDDVRSIIAVPYESQDSTYDPGRFSKSNYRSIRNESEEYVISEDPVSYEDSVDKLMKRNEWMLNHSSAVITAHTGKKYGGTAKTLRAARKKGMKVTNVI